MRIALSLLALGGVACMDLGAPQATIHVHNAGNTAQDIRITDNAECQLGMTTQLNQNTRTTYDVDAAKGGFICVGAESTTGFPVKGDGYYMIKGGQVVKDPNPEGANAASGGILDSLEAAGREAQGQ